MQRVIRLNELLNLLERVCKKKWEWETIYYAFKDVGFNWENKDFRLLIKKWLESMTIHNHNMVFVLVLVLGFKKKVGGGGGGEGNYYLEWF